jgi:hypothetical protein
VTAAGQQPILLGAYAGAHDGLDTEASLSQLERLVGQPLGLHRIFRAWSDPSFDTEASRSYDFGRVPLVSWKPIAKTGKVSWADIAAGKQDTKIAEIAGFLQMAGTRAIICFHHEPELAVGYGTPAEYAAAFDHWRGQFDRSGVTGVQHAVICSPRAYRDHGAIAARFWPTAPVDLVGVNAYNWFGCSAGQETAWVPLGNSCRSAVTWATERGLPLAVAEWGSVEDPARPGRKGDWITQALEWAKATPVVRALSYQHGLGSCPWWLDSSDSALAAFRRAVEDPRTN